MKCDFGFQSCRRTAMSRTASQAETGTVWIFWLMFFPHWISPRLGADAADEGGMADVRKRCEYGKFCSLRSIAR